MGFFGFLRSVASGGIDAGFVDAGFIELTTALGGAYHWGVKTRATRSGQPAFYQFERNRRGAGKLAAIFFVLLVIDDPQYQFFFCFCDTGSWTMTIAANIMTQPRSSRGLMRSLRIKAPASTANTDSRLISSDATVGSVCFWATIWRVYPMPPDTMPQYRIGIIADVIFSGPGDSMMKAAIHEMTAVVVSWIADMRIGFPLLTKWSQQRMCPLKSTAQMQSSVSPCARWNCSVMHSRYMPATPSSTASQTSHVWCFLKSRKLMTGTMSMYSAVMNPALPAVVYTIPICWKMLPNARKMPQQMPPMIVFPEDALSSPVLPGAAFFLRQIDTIPTANAARVIRDAVNVMGSMLSIPTRWKANAVPHMIATRISRRLPSILFFSITHLPDLYLAYLSGRCPPGLIEGMYS